MQKEEGMWIFAFLLSFAQTHAFTNKALSTTAKPNFQIFDLLTPSSILEYITPSIYDSDLTDFSIIYHPK